MKASVTLKGLWGALLASLALLRSCAANDTNELSFEANSNFDELKAEWLLSTPQPDFSVPGQFSLIFADLMKPSVRFTIWANADCEGEPDLKDVPMDEDRFIEGAAFYGTFWTTNNYNLTATFLPEGLQLGSRIYSETSNGLQVRAQIQFCMRVSIYYDITTDIEVNFQETIVTLYIDMTDGFAITEFSVAQRDRLVKTANQIYEVTGSLCDGSAQDEAYNQGSVICVNVEPESDALAAGLVMRRIDFFSFQLTDTLAQICIDFQARKQAQGYDLLTNHEDCDGEVVCTFTTILRAEFYQTLVEGPQPVTGSGIATMRFASGFTPPSRRLLGAPEEPADERDPAADRQLQIGARLPQPSPIDAAASEFDVNLMINSQPFPGKGGRRRKSRDRSSATGTALRVTAALLAVALCF